MTFNDRLLLWLARGRATVDGLWIGTLGNKNDKKVHLPKVEEALELIKVHDRRRYDRLHRDLKRIIVHALPASVAEFNERLAVCKLDSRFVLEQPPELIAAAIVHEATHARLHAAGLGYDEPQRLRIETLCLREEIRFAAKLPNGEAVRAWADATLAQPHDFTDATLHETHVKGLLDRLRDEGVPEWVLRATLAAAAVRSRIARAVRGAWQLLGRHRT